MCGHIAQFPKILQKKVTLEIFKHNFLTMSVNTEKNNLLNSHIEAIHDSRRGKTLQNMKATVCEEFENQNLYKSSRSYNRCS